MERMTNFERLIVLGLKRFHLLLQLYDPFYAHLLLGLEGVDFLGEILQFLHHVLPPLCFPLPVVECLQGAPPPSLQIRVFLGRPVVGFELQADGGDLV